MREEYINRWIKKQNTEYLYADIRTVTRYNTFYTCKWYLQLELSEQSHVTETIPMDHIERIIDNE